MPPARLLLVVFVLAGLLASLGQPAGAAEADGEQRLDLQTTYTTAANSAAQQLQVPIPSGMTPTKVSGDLLFDAEVSGRVEVLTAAGVAATVTRAADEATLPVEFPVTAADLDDGYLVFSWRFLTDDVTDPALVCVVSDDGTVQLRDVQVVVSGEETPPTTLADFFGPGVRAISIVVPADAAAGVQEAALTAEAALTHRYDADTAVTVTTPSGADRAADVTGAAGRLVELVPGEGAPRTEIGDRDGVHVLTITGDPDRLTEATAALGSDLLGVADSTSTTSLSATGTSAATPELSLADLGQQTPTLKGIGQSELVVNVTQSDFGMSASSLKVHLVGDYAALPDQLTAVVSYYWNDNLVDSQVLGSGEESGDTHIDRTIEIPHTLLRAANALRLRLDAVPVGSGSRQGIDCGGPLALLPIEVTFDGAASTLTATPGDALDPGFARFPQVLGNVVSVAFGDDAEADQAVTNAATVIRSLQLLNAAPLTVHVVTADEFVDSSRSGLVVGASAEQVDALDAPLRMGEIRAIDSEDADFGAGVTDPYAALQAFSQDGRDVLLLSSWGSAEVGNQLQDRLSDALATQENGWYDLVGDLFVQQSLTKEPVLFSTNAIVPQEERLKGFSSYGWWVLGFLVLCVLLFLGQLYSRRRLHRRAARLVDAQEQEDLRD
ncbi:hypothetical protein [Nocardioides sp.]|uniref:hypothetical protein n=1 Tax=Nocardioides sp. TaxID=35761 RepID=UPI0039E311D5